ncbi:MULTISPECIES: hypothetical protein [Mesorhizobium]|uniref:hypothetical protein n=1 Tax=Mesorhizobium TaxID=68287 RepID=UPI0010A954AD|nr:MULTISPECIES: hypothetical protein [Mesorhizobium]
MLALRRQGISTAEIAARIGIKTTTVSALEHSAGRAKRAPRPLEELCRTVLFPIDVLNALGPHAAKRNMHPNRLARLIVETVSDEKMIDAVLDDADDLKGWA